MSGKVDVDGWWTFLEGTILEGIIFKDITEDKVIATCIAPWIPPACRGHVVNTEYLKSSTRKHHSPPTPAGCPKMLATSICDGIYDPLNLGSTSITQLREVCELVGLPKELVTTKVCTSIMIYPSYRHRCIQCTCAATNGQASGESAFICYTRT